MNDLPKRKHPRLKNYDYSQPNSYFLTVCTKGKKCIFGTVIQNDNGSASVQLSPYGEIVKKYILSIEEHYENTVLENYVIMPNHIHILISIYQSDCKNSSAQNIVKSLKSLVTKEIGEPIWQDSFYDTVIDNEFAFENIWYYISGNPEKWLFQHKNVPTINIAL